MNNNELTYDHLKLGEKAKEALLSGKDTQFIREQCPIYLNTNESGAIGGLNTTDLAIAGVLAGLAVLVGGQYGSGKSQLASDIYHYYFGGAKLSGGESVRIDVNPDTNIIEPTYEIYTRWSRDAKGNVCPPITLSPNVQALFHFLDEINRTPTPKQNQFYPLLNGHITDSGKDTPIGRDGFRAIVATANIGNGLYQGTFDFDPALRNRFGVVIDTNYALFEPTVDDRGLIDLLREAEPGLKVAPIRNISDLILKANKEIKQSSANLSIEEKAALWYIREGLKTCLKKKDTTGVKEGEFWFDECRDCPGVNNNPNERAICSYMSSPVPRTIESTKLYASALAYLINLKNPQAKVDGVNLIFKAFELTAAYQPFVNPDAVQAYKGHLGKLMGDACSKLKAGFRAKEDMICSALESAERGKTLHFLKKKDTTPDAGTGMQKINDLIKIESDGTLSERLKVAYEEVDVFGGDEPLSLRWVPSRANLIRAFAKKGGN